MDTPYDTADALDDENKRCHKGGHRLLGEASATLRNQAMEIERLRAALKKANEQAEHFEREWYLRGDALEQLLDDMGEEGHCVCEAAKQMAKDAMTPNGPHEGRPD